MILLTPLSIKITISFKRHVLLPHNTKAKKIDVLYFLTESKMRFLFSLLTIFLVFFYGWVYFYVPELIELSRAAEIEFAQVQLLIITFSYQLHSPYLIFYTLLPLVSLLITILLFHKNKRENNTELKHSKPWIVWLSRAFILLCVGVMVIIIYGSVLWVQKI